MTRSFFPFFLAILGLATIFFVSTNALFEWQISHIVTDVPSSYEVHVSSSPWKTRISDALSDNTYVFTKLSIRNGDQYCSSKAFNIVVERSRTDELIERLMLMPQFKSRSSDWRVWWALIEVVVSMVFLMWFTVWQKPRTFTYIVISWMFVIISSCLIVIPTMKLMGPRVGV